MKQPAHQFSLFDHNTMRPRFKVPISAARIAEVKKLIADGDGRGAAEKMRDLREGLERVEQSITNRNRKDQL